MSNCATLLNSTNRATTPADKELLLYCFLFAKYCYSLTVPPPDLHFKLVYVFAGLLKVIVFIQAPKRSTNSELKWGF